MRLTQPYVAFRQCPMILLVTNIRLMNRRIIVWTNWGSQASHINNDSHSGTRGGGQSYSLINESGLNNLGFRSRKPEAKAFRNLVASTVNPKIEAVPYTPRQSQSS
jgi:hypothetical protein